MEEPLEIRLDGHPVAVVMRTPGHDDDLAAGFLVTEGIISKVTELRKIEPRPEENRVLVFLQDGVAVDLGRLTRHLFTGSSCGLCGKATLEAIFTRFPADRAAAWKFPNAVLLDSTCESCVRRREPSTPPAAYMRREYFRRMASCSSCARTSAATTRWTR